MLFDEDNEAKFYFLFFLPHEFHFFERAFSSFAE